MLSSREDVLRAMPEGLEHRQTCTVYVDPARDLHRGDTFLLTLNGSTHECVIIDVNETFIPSQGLVKEITITWKWK